MDSGTNQGASLDLSAGFPAPTLERWRTLAEKSLGGASLDTLTARTSDGIAIAPLYTAADAPAGRLIARAAPGGWDIRQIVSRSDPRAANEDILAELEGGATSVELRLPGGGGIESDAEFAATLDGVMLDMAPVALDAFSLGAAEGLAICAAKRGMKHTALAFNLSPLTPDSFTLGAEIGRAFPNARLFRIDARAVHEDGGSEAQEIAALLRDAVTALRACEAAGIAMEDFPRRVLFTLAVGPDTIVEIAKLRAARLVLARMLSACGVTAPITLQAVTGRRMMTTRDAWTNMLRVTAAGFAAGVGGADIVTTAPLTEALGAPTPFARRVARNTQILLLEEAHLARVEDPAAGAWAVEALTDQIARAAWALFQHTEQTGEPLPPDAIAKVRERRVTGVRRRKTAIVGVSEYTLLGQDEPRVEDSDVFEARQGMRLAEPFEHLRDAAQKAGAPAIFLATLGAPGAFAARASFAKGLFEAGGLPTRGGEDHHADVGALVASFAASGAHAACLCASDADYAASAEMAVRALKQAGCTFLALAGKPGASEETLRAAGVDAFVFAGQDAVTQLELIQRAMGVRP
jgi:methylmalonyl-CoA mutase